MSPSSSARMRPLGYGGVEMRPNSAHVLKARAPADGVLCGIVAARCVRVPGCEAGYIADAETPLLVRRVKLDGDLDVIETGGGWVPWALFHEEREAPVLARVPRGTELSIELHNPTEERQHAAAIVLWDKG